MSTPLAVFGPGILIASRTDITIPAPVNVGFVQEFSIEAAGTIKELFGQNQWPLAVARGTIKGTGKFKAAVISGLAWSALFYGNTETTSNQIAWNVGSTFTLSTASTQQQVGSSLTFDADLGITYVNTGLPFQRVSTGSESSGKYSVGSTTPGLYNFAATETTSLAAGTTIPIKITYTNTTTVGGNLTITNQLIGSTPTFQLDYYTNFNQPASKPFVVRIFSCVAAKHMMQFKLEDFMIPEFDFSLFANAAGNVYSMTFPEIS
jgi:hypothetical protein